SAGESGRACDIVVGRRLNGGNANAGQGLFHGLDDGLESAAVTLKDVGIEGAIAAVVHPEHDGQDGGFVGDHVALKANLDGPPSASRDAVAAPSGMDVADHQTGKARQHVALGEGGVEPLIGNAVAVEDDAVTVLEVEIRLRPGSCG